MDLLGILHVVDTPSSGKRDFKHILCCWFDSGYFDPL